MKHKKLNEMERKKMNKYEFKQEKKKMYAQTSVRWCAQEKRQDFNTKDYASTSEQHETQKNVQQKIFK